MTKLLNVRPYLDRDDRAILEEMNELTQLHVRGCPEYATLFSGRSKAATVEELPFLHVGLFKRIALRTEFDGVVHERTLLSSSTTGVGSRIVLDKASSELQRQSSTAILRDFVGDDVRPLLIIDSVKSLQQRGEISARVAAALSLRPLASELFFCLEKTDDICSLQESVVLDLLRKHNALLVYGFSWILWKAWGERKWSSQIQEALAKVRICFVHSGGWKKLESAKVDRAHFDEGLLKYVGVGSKVVDYYGLVEQVGVIYPLCKYGFRHAPRWGDVLVREPRTMELLVGEPGVLQLMNVLALGAPYQNVLTEDMGIMEKGECLCGRRGPRFTLVGRMPNAEMRGCANV